jgi:hypothetical protein
MVSLFDSGIDQRKNNEELIIVASQDWAADDGK